VIEFGTHRDMGGHASFVSTVAIRNNSPAPFAVVRALVPWRRLLKFPPRTGGQMSQTKAGDRIYRHRRFEGEIIELCVRW
jgi:hypothetical protein